MTPMVDIVFLLIIFFMVGTEFTEMDKQISLQVPQVSDANALTAAPEKRVISVYRDGRIQFDGEFVTIAELKGELIIARSQYEGLGVIVRGDAEGTFQNVANVLNAVRQAGIGEMGISVRMAKRGD